MEEAPKYFVCDSKYENIISELTSRGWTRDALFPDEEASRDSSGSGRIADTATIANAAAEEDGEVEGEAPYRGEEKAAGGSSRAITIPSRCVFIWMNLSSIKFPAVFDRFVNHLRGSQHMSNKGYLTYHLRASGQGDLLPPTWSSSFEDAIQLIEMVFLHEITSCASKLRESSKVEEILQLRRVHAILCMNSTWAKSDLNVRVADALAHLQRLSDDPHGPISVTALDDITRILANPSDPHSSHSASSSHENIWIIKPIGSSCGRNISVAKGWRALEIVARDMNYKCVVQKYIERPLLVRRRQKFDIRQWVLITSVNPLVIHGFSQCYLRLSSQEYTLDGSRLSDPLVHLCNNSIQKRVESEAKELDSEGSGSYLYHPLMMSQDEFADLLNMQHGDDVKHPNGVFVDVIKEQIKTITINSLRSVRDKLDRVGKGFEWLGFDLMVTDDLRVKLIEINTSPDMTNSTPITEWLVKAATTKLMDLIMKDKKDRIRSSESDHKEPDWELWYYGKSESRAELQKVTQAKVDRCSQLSPDYRPAHIDALDRVVAFTSDNAKNECDEDSEDEL